MSFKMKKRAVTIGHGDFKYEVDKNWGIQDPSKIPVKDCHEMIQDKTGRLFLLTNHVKNNVIIYDRSGKVLKTWTNNMPGAHGLTYWEEGGDEFLFMTDTVLHKVYKTTLDGKVLMTLDYPKESGVYDEESQYKPTETAIAPNGDIYVADGYGKNYITYYSKEGEYKGHFGGTGKTNDTFDCCHGILVDHRFAEPSLLITSRSTQEVKRFSLDGTFKSTVSLPGCWICRPVIHGDYLYFAVIVTKSWGEYDGMVAILDKNNSVVSMPGGNAPSYTDGLLSAAQSDYATFLNPHDVCIDQDENIYVPQWYSGRTYPIKLTRV
jgi:sugar lactone lactonase YvrE